METPAKQRYPRAAKSTSGRRFSSNKRPFNYNSHHESKTLGDTANHSRDDDDVVICDDVINDAMREDLEKALQPPRPKRSLSSATPVGQGAPKLIIEGVSSITRNEFEKDTKRLQKAEGTAATQRQAENGDSSDSDVEIIKEIPASARSRVPSTSIASAVNGPRLKSPSFSLEPPPLIVPAPVYVASSLILNTGLRSLAPRAPPIQPQVVRPVPPPPLVRQPTPTSRLLPAQPSVTPQSSKPPVPLIQRLIPARVPAVTTTQQQPRAPVQTVRTLVPQSLHLPQSSTPTRLSIPTPILAPSPISINPTSLMNLRSPVKRLIRGSDVPNVVAPVNLPTRGSTAAPIVRRSTSGATSVAHVTAKAPITFPQVGEDALPISGRSYIAQERGIQPKSKMVNRAAAFYQRPADNLRRRNVVVPSATSASSRVSTVKSKEDKMRNPTLNRTSGISAHASVKFPDGYYGRIQPVPYRLPEDGTHGFDGLFQCDGCKEIFITNISFVSHLLAHTLHPNSEDETLEDQTRCLSCWRDLKDPFTLESHCEQVHSKRVVSFACYICELNFKDDAAVRTHMIEKHGHGYEVPYACKPCRYRSSLFDDIWNHYLLAHKNTVVLMCPLCLYITDAGVSSTKYNKALQTANTNQFTAHMWKHVRVKSKFACDMCKLQFISQTDLKNHQKSSHRQLRPMEISATRTMSGVLTLKWDGRRPLTEVESHGQCFVSRRLQNETPARPRFTVAEANCVECGRAMEKRNHYSKLPRKCTDCHYTTFCVASFIIHKNTAHRDPALPPLPFEYSLVPKKRTLVLDKPARCACGYEDIFGNSLAKHLSTCSGSDGCSKPKEIPQTPPGKSLPLMSKAMRAALNLKSVHSDDNDQPTQRDVEPTPVPTRRGPQKRGKPKGPTPDEVQEQAKELEQQLKMNGADLSLPKVAMFLKLVQNPSLMYETSPASQDQPSTSYATPSTYTTASEGFSTKDNEDQPSCSYGTPITSPRLREPSTPCGSPSRPRLLSPQMALKRFSQASIPDEDLPQRQKIVTKPQSPLKSSKLGTRLFKQYEELNQRVKMAEMGLDGACELVAHLASNQSEMTKKYADELYDLLQTKEISDTLEEKPQQSTAKRGRKRKQ